MATGELSVARRYAAALFGAADKASAVDAVAENLSEVVQTVTGSRELLGVLHHPRLPREKKKAILHGVFGGKVRADVERFLFLVVEKDRAVLLPEMLREYNRLVDERRGVADAQVTTAVPLTVAQTASLSAALKARFGVDVRLQATVDEKLLGGLIVRVGDKMIDDSVATRLDKVKTQLKTVKVA